uniref:Cytidyltransferase-like domain-containing protein n=1 Tax=viral metagenome TaxID=1070528 RepID=A0A6C0KX69_9ZZZZ
MAPSLRTKQNLKRPSRRKYKGGDDEKNIDNDRIKEIIESYYEKPSTENPRDREEFVILDNDLVTKIQVPVPVDTVIVVPGSFNPMHDTHINMAIAAALQMNYTTIYFELSIINAAKDKPLLDELQKRIIDIINKLKDKKKPGKELNRYTVKLVITKAALFSEKKAIFPSSAIFFVTGMDTADRILDPKYYYNNLNDLKPTDPSFINPQTIAGYNAYLIDTLPNFLIAPRLVRRIKDGIAEAYKEADPFNIYKTQILKVNFTDKSSFIASEPPEIKISENLNKKFIMLTNFTPTEDSSSSDRFLTKLNADNVDISNILFPQNTESVFTKLGELAYAITKLSNNDKFTTIISQLVNLYNNKIEKPTIKNLLKLIFLEDESLRIVPPVIPQELNDDVLEITDPNRIPSGGARGKEKVTFIKNGIKYKRVVRLNNRKTKCVKFEDKLIPISKLKIK